ncbi:MAG: CAP domain-containing protein [Lachnospiraceae bacterium]|nr:CAP domain-containing protein [Lachnospiraceae bacterium]
MDDGAIALAADAGTATEYVDAAAAAFAQVNQLRAEAGLSELTWNSDLESAARVRATEATGFFSHTRPDGTAWWTVDSRVMYGENLAKGFYDADSVVTAWMNSPTHRENVMKDGFKTMAIVIVAADNGTWYWAQEFGY